MTDIVRAHVLQPGRVLLGLRHPPNERWSTFGGWSEAGESPEDTLRREVKEELGIEIEAFHRLPDRQTTWDGKPARVVVFAVTGWRGSPKNTAPHEHAAISWFSRDELERLSMHDAARTEALGLLSSSGESLAYRTDT